MFQISNTLDESLNLNKNTNPTNKIRKKKKCSLSARLFLLLLNINIIYFCVKLTEHMWLKSCRLRVHRVVRLCNNTCKSNKLASSSSRNDNHPVSLSVWLSDCLPADRIGKEPPPHSSADQFTQRKISFRNCCFFFIHKRTIRKGRATCRTSFFPTTYSPHLYSKHIQNVIKVLSLSRRDLILLITTCCSSG